MAKRIGSFSRWAKTHGYDGVTPEAIEAGIRAGGKIATKAKFAKTARKARHAQGGVIEGDEYSLGGILSSTGSGVGAGAMIGGPWGAIVGGAIGLGAGIFGHVKEKRTEDIQQQTLDNQQSAIEEAQQQQQQDEYLAGVGGSENPYTPTFPYGGLLSYANAEVEDDEILQRPDGKLKKMSGKTHASGGIDVNEPVGTRVFSDRVKYKATGKTFAEEADVIRKQIAQLDNQLA